MPELFIDPEFRGLIPPLSAEEYRQLEQNLLRDGCREPLSVWRNGNATLLDGHNRLKICEAHGLRFGTVDVKIADRDDAKIWIIRNQWGRRNITPYQRCELALKLESIYAKRAKENLATAQLGLRGGSPLPMLAKAIAPIDTREEIAKQARVSHGTIAKAKVIAESAPEPVKEKLCKGESTINKEYKAIVNAERRERQLEDIRRFEAESRPDGKYDVLVADPPWAYEKRAIDATHRGASPYPPMTQEQIIAFLRERMMPVAADHAILWLWTTNAFMLQAHEVAAAVGFEVKTILTCAKDRIGTGDWLRGQTEHCLMAVRGKPLATLTNQEP